MPKTLDEMTRAELDDVLDQLAHAVSLVLRQNISDPVTYVIAVGGGKGGGYRGAVTNLDKGPGGLAKAMQEATDCIKAGQQEW